MAKVTEVYQQVQQVEQEVITYAWEDGDGNAVATPGAVGAGTYHVTATDANGCEVTGSTVVTEPAVLAVTGSATDASCYAGADGSCQYHSKWWYD